MAAPHHIFERAVHLRRQQAVVGEAVDQLDRHVATELEERLSVINHVFQDVGLLAARPGALRKVLEQSGKCFNIKMMAPVIEEGLDLPEGGFDCFFSILDLQTVNDVPGYLAQVARSLRPDGLAMFAFFAGETLKELRAAWLAAEEEILGGVSPRVAPMIDLRETGGLLQRAGLALPVADMDRLVLRYADAFSLMGELKRLGFSNPLVGRSSRLVSRRLLTRVAEIYHQNHADADGKIRATIEVAWAMAWKPHPSQQQPLKPGSARQRLADALKKTDE